MQEPLSRILVTVTPSPVSATLVQRILWRDDVAQNRLLFIFGRRGSAHRAEIGLSADQDLVRAVRVNDDWSGLRMRGSHPEGAGLGGEETEIEEDGIGPRIGQPSPYVHGTAQPVPMSRVQYSQGYST